MQHKPFKTIDEQIELLQDEKNLIIDDEKEATFCLENLNYYRLSGYSLTMRKNDKFYKGSKFSDIMQIYNFDRELKLCILRYLEEIEIAPRTHIAYELGKQDVNPQSTVSYLKPENYISEAHFDKFSSDISKEIQNNREEAFVKHHNRKYNGVLPAWAMVETLSFGKASTLFSSLNAELKKEICTTYYHNIRYTAVENLLEGLVVLRNICAHHARLYNRGITVKPDFAKWEIDYLCNQNYERGQIGSKLFFRILVIIRLSPDPLIIDTIISDICALQKKYPFVNLKHYGFQPNWKEILTTMNEKYKQS